MLRGKVVIVVGWFHTLSIWSYETNVPVVLSHPVFVIKALKSECSSHVSKKKGAQLKKGDWTVAKAACTFIIH